MSVNKLQAILDKEAAAIQNIPLDGNIEKAVDLIHQQVTQKGGKLIVAGVGKAGQVATRFASTLCSTGTTACFLHPLEAQHGDLGLIQPNDALFLISNSGKTRELLELAPLARKLAPNIPIIGLTRNGEAPLNDFTDVTVLTGKTTEVCPLGLSPTTSITVMTVICDLFIVSLMEKNEFQKSAYSLRHHSGYLGDKARQQ